MKKVILNMKEQNKYEIIKKVSLNKLSKSSAEIRLGVTRRTIDRLLLTYRLNGKNGFKHGNNQRKPVNSFPHSFKKQIVLLYQTKYYDTSFKLFHELLLTHENINVSYSFVFKTLTDSLILSLKPTRVKRKRIQKQIAAINFAKNNPHLSLEQVIKIPNLVSPDNAHPRREAAKYSGELVQMDASHHHWFGEHNPKAHLHGAIDDASKSILALYFDTQETLNGYFHIFNDILNDHGIPELFFTYKRTVFTYQRKNGPTKDGQDPLTQFSAACKQLGTRIYTSSVPEHKARIERLFQTLQHRLIPILRLNKITTIKEANKFLKEVYIPMHNAMFAKPLNSLPNGFAKVDENINLELILARKLKRKVDNGSCISYNNKYYIPYENNSILTFKAKTVVTVIDSPITNNKFIEVNGIVYPIVMLNENKQTSKTLDHKINNVITSNAGSFSPSNDHPFKRASFEKMQAKKQNKRKVY